MRSNQPTILAALANASTYGGGMKIAPHAQIDDGHLDVCVIGGTDPFTLACMFPAVYFGRHLRVREVDHFQATRLRVETEASLEIYADGELGVPHAGCNRSSWCSTKNAYTRVRC